MKNTRHGTTNYRRLMQFIGDMAPHANGRRDHKRYQDGMHLPLAFEYLHYKDYKGRPVFSMTHWGELNGDAMRDPDITFSVDYEAKTVEPMTFQNDYLGIYQEVYIKKGETWLYSQRLRSDLDQHIYEWLNMIEQCDFQLEKKEA